MNKYKMLIALCLININTCFGTIVGTEGLEPGHEIYLHSRGARNSYQNNSQEFNNLYAKHQELLNNFHLLQNQNLELNQQKLQLEALNLKLRQQISMLENKIDLLLEEDIPEPVFHDDPE
ncbi:MAG: hypothetical protein P4L22_01790 [Candidatus Babeliales bacterium]|nr:hypothetical protein [Candidatus Babeliales bacterium]